jgi:hypothetical protein
MAIMAYLPFSIWLYKISSVGSVLMSNALNGGMLKSTKIKITTHNFGLAAQQPAC